MTVVKRDGSPARINAMATDLSVCGSRGLQSRSRQKTLPIQRPSVLWPVLDRSGLDPPAAGRSRSVFFSFRGSIRDDVDHNFVVPIYPSHYWMPGHKIAHNARDLYIKRSSGCETQPGRDEIDHGRA